MQTPVLAIFLLAATTATLEAQRGRGRNAPEALENFTWQEKTFKSEAIGDEAPYFIYLPKGYDDEDQADTKYPLIIWLHGMFEDHRRFHSGSGAPYLDRAVTEGQLPPCILVCPFGGRRSMYINREDDKWQDLITVDLLEHLNKNYRVSQRREERALMGLSMGGMAALRIGLSQPELFGIISTHSAAVFSADPADLPGNFAGFASRLGLDEVLGKPIEREAWDRINPLCIALQTRPEDLKGLVIRFDAGDRDRYGFHQGNELLHEALEKQGIDHEWSLIEGGRHAWGRGFQHEALPPSFAMIGTAMRAAQAKKKGLEGLKGSLDGKADKSDGEQDGRD